MAKKKLDGEKMSRVRRKYKDRHLDNLIHDLEYINIRIAVHKIQANILRDKGQYLKELLNELNIKPN